MAGLTCCLLPLFLHSSTGIRITATQESVWLGSSSFSCRDLQPGESVQSLDSGGLLHTLHLHLNYLEAFCGMFATCMHSCRREGIIFR